ncbi:MAG TPA: YetF domain-containing protein [Chloroflexota bacterium]|nr:YetF domain-containing protein [Chloroflexota bacterium]
MIGQWLAAVFTYPDLFGTLVIAGKTMIVYVFLILGLRLLGKRELGQMTLYDLVLIIVLANAVQNAMVGSDTTLLGGIVAATTLLALNRLFNYFLVRSPALERETVGEPALIIQNGQLLSRQLRREGVTEAQVMAALREHEIDRIADVKMAVLEVDGTISVVPWEARILRTRHRVRGLRLT